MFSLFLLNSKYMLSSITQLPFEDKFGFPSPQINSLSDGVYFQVQPSIETWLALQFSVGPPSLQICSLPTSAQLAIYLSPHALAQPTSSSLPNSHIEPASPHAFSPLFGMDFGETFSPAIKPTTVRIVLSLLLYLEAGFFINLMFKMHSSMGICLKVFKCLNLRVSHILNFRTMSAN